MNCMHNLHQYQKLGLSVGEQRVKTGFEVLFETPELQTGRQADRQTGRQADRQAGSLLSDKMLLGPTLK